MSTFFKMISQTRDYQENRKLLLDLLASRGQNVETFFDEDLRNLPDFSSLLDVEKAALRVIKAINNQELIGIYGDYDADGCTALACFYQFLKLLGVIAKTYQPSRFVEGYGLHRSSIEKAKADGVKLLITFDCGIMNHESATYAKEVDLDLIITDHHNDGSMELPLAVAVVNPSRSDQAKSELKSLAGVGVAFALAHEVKRHLGREMPSIYPLLQYVAIGTIGDMVNLNPMNLKLVRHGLKQFPKSNYPAIKAFFKLSNFPEATSEFIGFTVAPLINAKGRLDNPEDALKLLISENQAEAIELLEKLQLSNSERKETQAANVIIARNKIKKHRLHEDKIIVVYSDKLHQGVIGLVASGLIRELKRPAIVLTDDESKPGVIKGSVRSVGEFDIFTFLKGLNFPFLSFGGHKKAAGLSISVNDLEAFQEAVRTASRGLDVRPDEVKGIPVKLDQLNIHLAVAQRDLEPFGEGNPRPLFEVVGNIERTQVVKEKHLRVWLEDYATPFMVFNYFEPKIGQKHSVDSDIPKGLVKLTTSCKLGFFNNGFKLDLLVEDICFL